MARLTWHYYQHICLLFAGLFFTYPASAVETIVLATYHDTAPFIVNKQHQSGLSYMLADYLTAESEENYSFQIKTFPRKRLDKEASKMSNLVLLWAHPSWFTKVNLGAGTWTKSYYRTINCLIHKRDLPMPYLDIERLKGKQVAGLRGGAWNILGPYVDSGEVTRIDTNSHEMALRLVEFGRTDFAKVPKITFDYLSSANDYDKLSCTQFGRYAGRHFFVKKNEKLFGFLEYQADAIEKGKIIGQMLKKLVEGNSDSKKAQHLPY